MFRIDNIGKKYGNQKVLSDINMTIPENQLTCIIGPNGAGKSTLLNAISRLLKPDHGAVYLNDQDILKWNNKELSKTLSILKQMNNLNMRLTISDLVAFGRYPYSEDRLTEEDHRIINKALKYTELEDIKDKFLDELSGGQRQRAYIAMTLAQDTKYILLDEPLNNLDIKHILEVMHLLKRLVKEENKTIIIVVHDINIASTFADHIIAMKKGEVVDYGDIDKIINNNILGKIYDIEFHIEEYKGKKICMYY